MCKSDIQCQSVQEWYSVQMCKCVQGWYSVRTARGRVGAAAAAWGGLGIHPRLLLFCKHQPATNNNNNNNYHTMIAIPMMKKCHLRRMLHCKLLLGWMGLGWYLGGGRYRLMRLMRLMRLITYTPNISDFSNSFLVLTKTDCNKIIWPNQFLLYTIWRWFLLSEFVVHLVGFHQVDRCHCRINHLRHCHCHCFHCQHQHQPYHLHCHCKLSTIINLITIINHLCHCQPSF